MAICASPFARKLYLNLKRPDRADQPTDRRVWGYLLQRERRQRELSVQETAEALGVTAVSVHRWESLIEPCHVKYIPAIVEFIGFVPWCRSPYQQTMGQAARALRELRGLIQRQMAKLADVCAFTLMRVEADRPVSAGSLAKIERALGFPLRDSRAISRFNPA